MEAVSPRIQFVNQQCSISKAYGDSRTIALIEGNEKRRAPPANAFVPQQKIVAPSLAKSWLPTLLKMVYDASPIAQVPDYLFPG